MWQEIDVFPYLPLTTLWCGYHYSYEETGLETLSNISKGTWIVSDRLEIQVYEL